MRNSLCKMFWACLALCVLFPIVAEAESLFKRQPDGTLDYHGHLFQIIYWGKDWAGGAQNANTVSFPGEAGTYDEERGIVRHGTFKVPGVEFQLTDCCKTDGDKKITLEYVFDSKTPVVVNTLAVVTKINIDEYLKRPPVVNGTQRILSEKADDKCWQLFGPNQGIVTTELAFDEGILTLKGNYTLVIQDNRRLGGNDVELRFAFRPLSSPSLTHTQLRLEFATRGYDMTPLDLRKAMNMGFADEVADDQQGGWTDQGPDNDLHQMVPGRIEEAGLTFDIVDPADNDGKSCIVLGGFGREYLPQEASIDFEESQQGKSLFIMNGLAWSQKLKEGDVCGEVVIDYTDGTQSRFEMKNQIDTANFWGGTPYDNAIPVWSDTNIINNIALYATKIPMLDKPFTSLHFLSRGTVWMILGATVSQDDVTPLPPSEIKITESDKWVPEDCIDYIEPGSIADFSGILEAPSGKFGFCKVVGDHFEFENRSGVPARFWGGNATFDFYMWPENHERLASQLAATGMNIIRLHHVDMDLFREGYIKDSEIPVAERIRLMDHFVAECKKRGIYICLDLTTHMRTNRASLGLEPDAPVDLNEYKLLVMLHEGSYNHLMTFTRNLFNHVNEYTGLAWKDEPTIAFINLINEDFLPGSIHRTPFVKSLVDKRYAEWLAAQELTEKDGTPERFNRFLRELYIGFVERLSGDLRAMGLKMPFSNTNVGGSVRINAMRRTPGLDYADNHMYWCHPSYIGKLWTPPVCVSSASSIAAYAGGIDVMFPYRLFGRPYTLTEWDYVEPNPYNVEGGFINGAYSAFQNFSGLCNFSWVGNKETAKEVPAVMHHFCMVHNTMHRLSMMAGSVFFLRGDVRPSENMIPIVSQTTNLDSPNLNDNYPESIKRLALVTRTGSVFEDEPLPAGVTAVLTDRNIAPQDVDGVPVLPCPGKKEELFDLLEKKGVLPAGLYDKTTNVFTSDTGEIQLRPDEKSMRVVTPASEGLIADKGKNITGKFAQLLSPSTFTALLVASQDGRPLTETGRILILHLTDDKGRDMVFLDRGMSIIGDWGKPGLLLRHGVADISLAINPDEWELFVCKMTGARAGSVPLKQTESGAMFTADNANGLCIYELVKK